MDKKMFYLNQKCNANEETLRRKMEENIVHAAVRCPTNLSLGVILQGVAKHRSRYSDFSRCIYSSTNPFFFSLGMRRG